MNVLLDLFTGEVIESVHELQHLEVSQVTIINFIQYLKNSFIDNMIRNFNPIEYHSNTPCDGDSFSLSTHRTQTKRSRNPRPNT